jgi:hypothetical protein
VSQPIDPLQASAAISPTYMFQHQQKLVAKATTNYRQSGTLRILRYSFYVLVRAHMAIVQTPEIRMIAPRGQEILRCSLEAKPHTEPLAPFQLFLHFSRLFPPQDLRPKKSDDSC